MDVFKALSELYEEKKRVDALISALEARLTGTGKPEARTRKRRGRRSMSEQEREEVSRRMSRYWAARRAEKPDAERAHCLSGVVSVQSIQDVA